MSEHTHETTIERDGVEYACTLIYEASPAIPEGPSQYGEDAEVHIIEAIDQDGVGFILDRAERQRYAAEIMGALQKEGAI